nr:MAG TPA: hypothetical protein [Caudoviricetes sp.]
MKVTWNSSEDDQVILRFYRQLSILAWLFLPFCLLQNLRPRAELLPVNDLPPRVIAY